MCGITGWIDWHKDLTGSSSILETMSESLSHRGPDASGTWISPHCALGHRRLSVLDPENGAQPMVRRAGEHTYTITYNGEIYNVWELRKELESRGHVFRTDCDTEVLLASYIEWGKDCVDRLNGIFAFGIWSERDQSLFLARDRLGVKPLFYARMKGMLLFGSEPKAILSHPQFPVRIGAQGLAEIFALGPARTPGHGIYEGLSELKPGHWIQYDQNGMTLRAYWKLEASPHTDSVDETAYHVRELLQDTVQRQLISDVPLCSLLSGGLDSSALSTLAAKHYAQTEMNPLRTFSVDYVDNDKYFKQNHFQPNADSPWIQRMSDFLGTRHTAFHFDTPELVESLKQAVYARDMPGMADVDSSLYLFCREIKRQATVAISGEAADEIFGGYPWFHREETLKADTFPWSLTIPQRISVLSPNLVDWIRPQEYVQERYHQALDEVPHLEGEDREQKRMREMSYLNISRFMPTLLDRKDRMSMAVGLEVRVPFCDHRLVQYVWNIPWKIKTTGKCEKGILRKALKGILPDDVLMRKKSPYPKTHNPSYTQAVREWLSDIMHDPSSPLQDFVHKDRLVKMLDADVSEFSFPWFGQLMTGPQMFAFLGQVDTWLRKYKVSIV